MKDQSKLIKKKLTALTLTLATAVGVFMHNPKALKAAENNPNAKSLVRQMQTLEEQGETPLLHNDLSLLLQAQESIRKATELYSHVDFSKPGFRDTLKQVQDNLDLGYYRLMDVKGLDKEVQPLLEKILEIDNLIIDSILLNADYYLETDKNPLVAMTILDFAKRAFKHLDPSLLKSGYYNRLYKQYQKLALKADKAFKQLNELERRQEEIYAQACTTYLTKSKPAGDKIRVLLGTIKKLEQIRKQIVVLSHYENHLLLQLQLKIASLRRDIAQLEQ